jgi:hypothetical protein
MLKLNLITVLLFSFFIWNCTPRTSGSKRYQHNTSNAKIIISKSFTLNKHRTIAVLPFVSQGRNEKLDYSVSDKFALHCMEVGFRVVERSQLEKLFLEMNLELSGVLNKSDLNKIGELLNIDMIVFGTINSTWVPGKSLILDNYAGQREGYYAYTSETIRFVDVSSGEVLISTFCPANEDYSMSEEIAKGIKIKLNQIYK